MSHVHRILAWADADQLSFVRSVADHPALELVSIGAEHTDSAIKLANALEVEREDDLRRAMQRDDFDLFWLACPLVLEPATAKLIRERRLRVMATQPHPASLADLANAEEAATVHFVPIMRRSPGYRATADILSDFGEPRCVNITMRCGHGQGNLFARLFDAMDIIDALCGEPEIIDAALVSPTPGVAEALADLHGHMTINIRFPENRCACVAISDRAGAWFRGVTILGEGGCLRINDDGFEWHSVDGELVDSHQALEPSSPGQLVAANIIRVLEQLDTTDAPPDAGKLLAMCEAAKLSCRTGEGETPRKMLKMMSRV